MERFNIIFTGKVKPKVDQAEFIAAFTSRFKVSKEKARQIITSGKPVVIKKALDSEQAIRYLKVLDAMGMVVRREPTAWPLEPVNDKTLQQKEASPSAITICPKCGSDQIEDGSCLGCGIIIEKHLLSRRKQDLPTKEPLTTGETGSADSSSFVIETESKDSRERRPSTWQLYWRGTLIIYLIVLIPPMLFHDQFLIPFILAMYVAVLPSYLWYLFAGEQSLIGLFSIKFHIVTIVLTSGGGYLFVFFTWLVVFLSKLVNVTKYFKAAVVILIALNITAVIVGSFINPDQDLANSDVIENKKQIEITVAKLNQIKKTMLIVGNVKMAQLEGFDQTLFPESDKKLLDFIRQNLQLFPRESMLLLKDFFNDG